MARWIGSMTAANKENGSSVIPESSVSSVTANAPSSSDTMQARRLAAKILPLLIRFPAIGRNTYGYARKHPKKPRLNKLHPHASSPPSAKKRA